MTRSPRFATLVVGLALALPSAAAAHAVDMEFKSKDGRVVVDVFFDDDTPGSGAKVAVTAADGTLVAAGKADETGRWSFPAPPPGTYSIVADAGAGHRATRALTVDAPSAGVAGATAVTSDGPTREEFTGPLRFVWAAVGLLAIGAATWGLTRLMRAAKGATAGGE